MTLNPEAIMDSVCLRIITGMIWGGINVLIPKLAEIHHHWHKGNLVG